MDIKHVGDHECIQCGECISVCPTKAISWKGAKLFVRANETDAPAPQDVKPLAGMLKKTPPMSVTNEKTEQPTATETQTTEGQND